MDDTGSDIHKDVQSLFFTSQSLLLLNCNPKKENFKTNTNMTPEDRKLKEKACKDEAARLMKTYRALEEQVVRLENPESSSGPSNQDLATRVKQAREAFCSRVHSIIDMLTQHLVALTNTINGMNPENEVILGRSSDLKDYVEQSIERLQRQIKCWEKRIWRAGVSLSPIKSKILDMGRKKMNKKK